MTPTKDKDPNWIEKAVDPSKGRTGALRRTLKIKKGEKIPLAKLKAAAKKKGKTGDRARLALTLRKLRPRAGVVSDTDTKGRSPLITYLKPGDILLTQAGHEWGVFAPILRWLVGKWGHAMIYEGNGLVIEARPKKGVSRVELDEYLGTYAKVMRYPDPTTAQKAAEAAGEIADSPNSLYDFPLIPKILVNLVLRKFGIHRGRYKPDSLYVCSELVWEAYKRAGVILYDKGIPLPGDLERYPQLQKIMEGRLWVGV